MKNGMLGNEHLAIMLRLPLMDSPFDLTGLLGKSCAKEKKIQTGVVPIGEVGAADLCNAKIRVNFIQFDPNTFGVLPNSLYIPRTTIE